MTDPLEGKTVTARHAVDWIVGAFLVGLFTGALTVLTGVALSLVVGR